MESKSDITNLRSNISIRSNVYVVDKNCVNKLNDSVFMSHVVDPAALAEMNKKNFSLTKRQHDILNMAMPCAKNDGYTFGMMCLDGKAVLVNRCNMRECLEYNKNKGNPPNCDLRYIPKAYVEPDYVTPPQIRVSGKHSGKYVYVGGTVHPAGAKFNQLAYKIAPCGNKHNSWTRGYCKEFYDGAIVYIRPRLKKWGIRHFKHKITFGYNEEADRDKLLKFRDKCYEMRIKERPDPVPKGDTFEDNANYILKDRKFIKTPDVIVTSPIDSRILVNSGPGTGKTYTVIERLKYIVRKDPYEIPPKVYVLCFSRNAVSVIRNRLSDAIKSGEIPYSATKFNIYTFDSFVTSYLYQVGETPYSDDVRDSYDERIRQFTRLYKARPDVLNESMSYLIIDEMQDIVKDRAEMVQVLLSKISCGFLLLGDLCQAIYDYSADRTSNSISSNMKASELYRWIDSGASFSNVLLEYEITKNSRCDEAVDKLFKPLRKAILEKNPNEQKLELIKVMASVTQTSENFIQLGSDYTMAYLSWANSDAFSKSKELYSKSLNHEFRAGNRRLVFCRELSDIFSGYNRSRISADEFMSKGESKGIDTVLLDSIWNGILETMDLDHDESEVDMENLNICLSMGNKVRDSLLVRNTSNRTVSTVHKAKGSEYDCVKLTVNGDIRKVGGKDKIIDEIKVYYVALTRAKHCIEIIHQNTPIDTKNSDKRFYKLKYGKLSYFELGMDGDIDPVGFVANDISINTVEERQKYISQNVHPCDSIRVERVEDKYYIVHEGFVIGYMNPETFKPFSYYDYWKHEHTCSLDDVSTFTELYVGNVVAIVERKRDRRIPENYLNTGIWYGIDFCGMAKIQRQ